MVQPCEDKTVYAQEVHGCRYVMIASAILNSNMSEADPDSAKIMPIGTFEIILDGQNDRYALTKLFRMVHSDGIFATIGDAIDKATTNIKDLVMATARPEYSIKAIRGVVRKYDLPSGLFADGMVVDWPTGGAVDNNDYILVAELDWDA